MTVKGFVKTFQDKSFLLALFAILAIVLPGLTTISIYHPEQIVELDWIKLSLLSIAYTGPFVMLNSIIIGANDKSKRNTTSFFYDFIEGALITGVAFYLCLIFVLLFSHANYHLFGSPFSNEILFGIIGEIIVAVTIITDNTKRK